MPIEAMPLFNESENQHRKTEHILKFVLESGNFGRNREAASGKVCSVWKKTKDFVRHMYLFPVDSIKFFFHFLVDGIQLVAVK
jgi:hypothetical protein